MIDSNDRRQSSARHRVRACLSRMPAAVLCIAAVALSAAAAAQPGSGGSNARRDDRDRPIDHSIEVYIGENAMQAQYVRDIDVNGIGRVQGRAGVFYNEERDLIGIGDMLVPVGDRNVESNRALVYSVGSRAYAALLGTENEDIFGIGVGGEVEYFFNRVRRKTSLRVSGFYSPDILTFGQANNVSDVTTRLLTRISDNTDVFVGYRLFKIHTTLGHRSIDDTLHIGFRRSF